MQLTFPCFAVGGICLQFLLGQGELCVCILHLQPLTLLDFWPSKGQSKEVSPVPVAGEGLPAPQHSFLPKDRDPTALRWGKYNGECVAKHLGHFLAWHIQFCTSWGCISGPLHSWGEGVRTCSEREVLRHGTSCSGRALNQGVGTTLRPHSSSHGALPCLHLCLVLDGTCDFSALCLSLLLMEEENRS